MNWFTRKQGEQLVETTEGDPYKRINKKLAWIKKIDEDHEVFGAQKHQYEMNKPIKASTIIEVERRLGITLPKTYTLFLQKVANGGVGPNLGLLTFEKSVSVFETHKVWPISNEGAGHLIALGPFESQHQELSCLTDEVWLDAEDAGAASSRLYKKGELKTFLTWYEDWLNETIEYFIYKNIY